MSERIMIKSYAALMFTQEDGYLRIRCIEGDDCPPGISEAAHLAFLLIRSKLDGVLKETEKKLDWEMVCPPTL